jgi:glycosyltransferase involved in cell wall biosynthesis
MPEISVVIPAYNAAKTLRETLDSVLAQTFGDFEVIVVDDGSKDDTAAVASATSDPRVRVISIPNGGVSRARNLGIAESGGALIAFLDADDLWQPTKLERQVALLNARPEVGICVTGADKIDSSSRPIAAMPMFEQSDDYTRDLLLYSNIAGCTCSGVVRRDVIDAIGGFEPELQYCEDWNLWLRLSLRTSFGVLPEPLVCVRIHEGNTSGNPYLLERDTFLVLDSFFAMPDAAAYAQMRARVYGTHWMVCAGSYLHRGRPIPSVRCVWRGIAAYPASVSRPLGLPRRRLARAFRRLRGARS